MGQPFCKEPIFDFFGGSPVFAGESHQLVSSPFCKYLTMDVCKVNSWVPYKMVALGQVGKCAGGLSFKFHSLVVVCCVLGIRCVQYMIFRDKL